MKQHLALLLAATMLGGVPAGALAQSAPSSAMPASSAAPGAGAAPASSPAAPASAAPASAAPAATPSGSMPAMTAAPTAKPAPAASAAAKADLSHVKRIPSGSLSLGDVRYGLTHPVQEANQVRKLKSISFDKLRVYRLSSGLKSLLKVGAANSDLPLLAVLGPGIELAQTTGLPSGNGNNSPIAYLQYVLANINVSNALNNVNVLNNSTVNVGVSLQDVLNGNKISIGQVAGIFVNGLGIITTITK